jgi:hypothetical protein
MRQPSDAPLLNPRRAPRLPLRCSVLLEVPGRAWQGETEDVGAHGCQLVMPEALGRGLLVRLRLAHPEMPASLRVSGQVAWSGPHAPWRHGVAFASSDLVPAGRWLGRLLSLQPQLVAASRIPAWLDSRDRLHLAEPPRHLVDFTPAELLVLRHLGASATLAELRHRLGDEWEAGARAVFSLLGRRALTLDHAGASSLDAWHRVLEACQPGRSAGARTVARIATIRLPAASSG